MGKNEVVVRAKCYFSIGQDKNIIGCATSYAMLETST